MSSLGLVVALPEMVLLAAASIVLVVDLFVSDERRNVTYGLTMLTLLLVGAAVCVALARNEVVVGFGGMYIADPMGHVLKLFAIFCSGFMLICAQSYARARGIWAPATPARRAAGWARPSSRRPPSAICSSGANCCAVLPKPTPPARS